MLNTPTESVADVMKQAARDGNEQVSDVLHVSAEATERAARAGADIMQKNTETMHHALHTGAEMAARLTEQSADQLSRVFGLSGAEANKAAQKSSENIDAILQSSSLLMSVGQHVAREWSDFARARMEENFSQMNRLLHCRTPQDVAEVQSQLWRDNLESFVQWARRVTETSVHTADEAARRFADLAERSRAA